MALGNQAKMVDISGALTALEPLGADQYCIAFGPGATQFCGTPKGYSTTQLPRKVVNDLLSGNIKKVLHASFGNNANSYFFTYEMRDGTIAHRAGSGIPAGLRFFVDRISSASKERASSLRVQLGASRSYVAWSNSRWISRGIPESLLAVLYHLSSPDFDEANGSQGLLMSGTIDNIAWHDSSSWYFKSGSAHEELRTSMEIIKNAWYSLMHANLAYVAIDPHSPTGGTFAFVEKTQDGREPNFVLRCEPEDTVSRLHSKQDPPSVHTQVINVPKKSEGLLMFQWAVSKYTGCSHARDTWELELKKGERVKVLKYMGNDWFFVENRRNEHGWVHKSWLDFQQMTPHVDPRKAYARFTVDVEKMFKAGNIRMFPVLNLYMNACTKDTCSPLKTDPHYLGICHHDLHELMRGSGDYSLDTLKTERNKWHPDRFARFCHPHHRETLREKAQALFVLFGVLMEKTPAPEPAA
ncbi:hypothetical protein PMIN03_011702 [Paraphaeosphaeria minitans]|uniref:SH3 domain-containing protein n=1 Tax=Paraphaeosphaeria minitans TaxID=565426 RepID=A0A9P6G6J0_9PLEO|nr:hypothetical protein PMIN01_13160 [Paraphaeosphaeria minitans]